MRLLQTNEIEKITGGLEGELTATLYYEARNDPPQISYVTAITGPADEILAKIKSNDYPSCVAGFERLKIEAIILTRHTVSH